MGILGYSICRITVNDKFIKEYINEDSNNRVLINELNRIRKSKEYDQTFLMKAYLARTKFCCLKDLEIIAATLGFNNKWIFFQYMKLSKGTKWINCKNITKLLRFYHLEINDRR